MSEYIENPLIKLLDSIIPKETIDGDDVRDIAEKFVDLDIEFTPVVPVRIPDPASNYLGFIPEPMGVVKEGNRYAVVDPKNHDYEWVSENEIKIMRARYLLLRGFFDKTFDGEPYSKQQYILAYYFPNWRIDLNKMRSGV